MPLPLYDSTQHKIPAGEDAQRQINHAGAHQGLWFERFFNQYDATYQVKDDAKSTFIKGLTGNCGNKETLQQAYFRQTALVQACQGRSIVLQADWHFATGLGNPHPVENGFLFHPTLAAPYLPGSSVKGLVRSWLEQQLGTDPEAKDLFYRLFGSEDKDPANCDRDFQAGEVIFFDALPVMPAKLVLDTMTPHMGGWYEKGGTAEATKAANQPADWHDPVPVPFLAAKEVVLMFSFAPRKKSDDQALLMQLVEKVLKDALYHAGAGAKTAAGYGGFSDPDDKTQSELDKRHKEQAEAQKAQQKAAELAQMSAEAQLVAALQEDAQKPENQQPGSGSGFVGRLIAALQAAPDWPDSDRQALVALYDSYKKYLSKNKEKELRQQYVKHLR